MFVMAEFAVLFDGVTACMVNYPEQIPMAVNLLTHLGMFVSYEFFAALLFWYWISETVGVSKRKWNKAAYILASMISICLTVFFLPDLQFIKGKYTNYSMGTSVKICYAIVALYCVFTNAVIISKHRNISKNKRWSFAAASVFTSIWKILRFTD